AAGGTARRVAREPRVPPGPRRGRAADQGRKRDGEGAASERTPSRDRTRGRSTARASAVRRIDGMRALEARIEAMELQLRQLAGKVEQSAQQGNYLETRRVSDEYASLERDLRTAHEERHAVTDQAGRETKDQ